MKWAGEHLREAGGDKSRWRGLEMKRTEIGKKTEVVNFKLISYFVQLSSGNHIISWVIQLLSKFTVVQRLWPVRCLCLGLTTTCPWETSSRRLLRLQWENMSIDDGWLTGVAEATFSFSDKVNSNPVSSQQQSREIWQRIYSQGLGSLQFCQCQFPPE